MPCVLLELMDLHSPNGEALIQNFPFSGRFKLYIGQLICGPAIMDSRLGARAQGWQRMLRVITWNFDYWKHRSFNDEDWTYLRDKIKPDVALLQEVSPPNLEAGEHFLFKIIGRR